MIMSPLLEIIAVTYKQDHIMHCFMESILAQTLKNWRTFLIHDGPCELFEKESEKYKLDPRINVSNTLTRYNDFGHSLRSQGLEKFIGNSEYLLITNADNYYVPTFIEEMCLGTEDFVYCNMIHNHRNYGVLDSKIERGFIDMGSFIVKTKIAKQVGFNHTCYAADWFFIQDLLKVVSSIRKVDKTLFVHN